jgi:hypothetical protein
MAMTCKWCDATSGGLCWKHLQEREARRRKWAPLRIAGLIALVIVAEVLMRLAGWRR